MSSIVGHALAGAAVASTLAGETAKEKRATLLALAALLALAPDLDVLIYMAFRPLGMTPHRGITHTVVFAALAGVPLALGLRRFVGLNYLRAFCICFGVWLSHSLLDFLMGAGPPVPFFWPYARDGYLLSFRLVPTAYYGLTSDALRAVLVSPATVVGAVLEVVIFTPLVMLSRGRDAASRLRLTLVSSGGLLLTVAIYNGWL